MAAPASRIPPPRADADKKTIPAQIAAEPKQNGNYSAKLAEALYSYGMYPEAEAAAKLAMTKGGDHRLHRSPDGAGPGPDRAGQI